MNALGFFALLTLQAVGAPVGVSENTQFPRAIEPSISTYMNCLRQAVSGSVSREELAALDSRALQACSPVRIEAAVAAAQALDTSGEIPGAQRAGMIARAFNDVEASFRRFVSQLQQSAGQHAQD